MIKLTKTGDDTDYCNTLLMEQVHLFNDEIYENAVKLMEDTGNLNIVIEEEENVENDENDEDKKPKNVKEMIQETIDKHNDNTTKTNKRDNKKDDDGKYVNKNHLTVKQRRGGLDTDDDIKHRKELVKIEDYDKSTRRHQDIRLYGNYF